MFDQRLTALLCSRLCHDLIGPVGAINNGIEILNDDDDPALREEAVKLLTHSVTEAVRRLTFFRLAFGAAGGLGETIRFDEARKAAEGMFALGRVKLAWSMPAGETDALDKGAMKVLLNLILFATAALPRVGTVTIVLPAPGGAGAAGLDGTRLSAQGNGARVTDDMQAALALTLDDAALDPHNAAAQLLGYLARDLGARLAITGATDRVNISVTAA